MNAIWIGIAIGFGVAAAIVVLGISWHRRREDPELGAVSNQWVAEHRLGQGHDPQR